MTGVLRSLLASVSYHDAHRVVTLMGDGAGEPGELEWEQARNGTRETSKVADPTGELAAAVIDIPAATVTPTDGPTVMCAAPACPCCGSLHMYERGKVAGSAAPLYLECADCLMGCTACSAWSWPPRDPSTTWRMQRALSDLSEPGDVLVLAALEISRKPELLGAEPYKACATGCGQPARTARATYCEACAAARKRYPNAKPAFPACCVEWQQRNGTRQRCPQHDDQADAERRYAVLPADMQQALDDHFGPAASGTGWGIAHGSLGGRTGASEGRTSEVSSADPAADEAADAWLAAHPEWWQ